MSRSQLFRSVLALFAAGVLAPAGQARPAEKMFELDKPFSFGLETFGPLWFRHAISSPRSLGRTSNVVDRPAEEMIYVGTLANPYNASSFISTPPLFGNLARTEPESIDILSGQDGTWVADASDVWSNSLRWLGGDIADGPAAHASITFNLTADRTITIDGAVASRTLGMMTIGDVNFSGTAFGYTIAASGGGTLTFDSLNLTALIHQTNSSGNNIISAPILLKSSPLNITNSSVNNLTISGSISASTAGEKTITTSTGLVTISGVIENGNGSVAIVQNGPGTLSLTNGANTYSGPTTINGGTIALDADSEPGTGQLNLSGGTLTTSADRAESEAVTNNIVLTTDSSITTTSAASSVNVNFSGTLSGTGGTLTINNAGGNDVTDVFAVRFSGGSFTMNRPIFLTGVTGTSSLNDFNTTGTIHTYNGVIHGTGSYNRSASVAGTGGTTIFTANSPYTGATTVNRGTLNILNGGNSASGRISGTSTITVNNGGTLVLSGNGVYADRINDGATMTLDGGTFSTGGLSEHGANNNSAGIGALTLLSSSIIDMGNGESILAFASSALATWTPGQTLNIYNWSGNALFGGGLDRLFFGDSGLGLDPTQLPHFQFYSGFGTGAFSPGAIILDDGEVVPLAPIPEPGTWIGATLALATIAFAARRRRVIGGTGSVPSL